jgi:hypothetical protein
LLPITCPNPVASVDFYVASERKGWRVKRVESGSGKGGEWERKGWRVGAERVESGSGKGGEWKGGRE